MRMYRAEYADEDVMEIILADNDMDALSEAWEMEKEHGTLFSLALLDEDYNVQRTILQLTQLEPQSRPHIAE